MTTIITLVLTLAVALSCVAIFCFGRWREQQAALRRTVVVNLVGGESLDGTLWEWRGQLAVLRDVTLVTPDGTRHPVDGEAVVPQAQINFMQVYGR